MFTLFAKQLTKTYKYCNSVNNINLQVQSGEIIGLIGHKNSGKTIICFMLMGIVIHDTGSIIINNNDISNLSLHERTQLGIGFIPKQSSIFRRLSVYDNIISVLQIRKDLKGGMHQNYANDLINKFNIGHLSNIMGSELYGSNRRIVEIIRALAANPKFIIMDEPFTNIDIVSDNKIIKAIKYLSSIGIGIMITDNKNFITKLNFYNRSYILNKGKIITVVN
ncbi:ATP-binding cassette domain-containing protein [Candidatus Pantoea edessiphila]|uniref:ABC transporter ATP-binding protein n=1 Tax=Candidatus Pantoea edessiphila TaxID=2044610 RepID=A0A2P5SW43_9GAMM|nr:ATP-binding cassette domain-containing protein [Candidatus Pantoea edessiphila]PPI86544.1 ABC transporter ATP-binding protein [Candidatus Pantoea edessiphila]